MVGTKGPQAPGTGVSCVSPFLALPVSRPQPPLHLHTPQSQTRSKPGSLPQVSDIHGCEGQSQPFPTLSGPWAGPLALLTPGGVGLEDWVRHFLWYIKTSHPEVTKVSITAWETKYISQGPPQAQSYSLPEHNTSKHLRPLIETGSITCESTLPPIKLKLTFEIFPLWNMTQKRTRCILTTYL